MHHFFAHLLSPLHDPLWRWQSRRWQWRFQCNKAAELSNLDVVYYAAGNGVHSIFAKACRAEARRRCLSYATEAK